jgi:hypothetical protein
MNETESCLTCNHQEHDAGQCKQCNCGESEIIRPRTWLPIHWSQRAAEGFGDYLNRLYTKSPVVVGKHQYRCQN